MQYEENPMLFYDIEVFQDNWCIVFKNRKKELVKVFWNGKDGEAPLKYPMAERVTHENHSQFVKFLNQKTIVAHNNYHYDDKILDHMIATPTNCTTQSMKVRNDDIIVRKIPFYVKRLYQHLRVCSLDLMQQSSPSGFFALKRYEANTGMNIKESPVDFTIDRPLTEEEFTEVTLYCEHDVDAAIDEYNERESSYFEPKEVLIQRVMELYPYQFKYNNLLRKTIAGLMGYILMGPTEKLRKWDYFRLTRSDEKQDTLDFLDKMVERGLPKAVVDMWLDSWYDYDYKDPKDPSKVGKWIRNKMKTVRTINGVKYEFSFGGLHGVPVENKGRGVFKNVIMLDVASLYPSIMINLNTLGDRTKNFSYIKDERMKVKHKNKKLSNGLKLGINGTYGCLNARHSQLFNPYASQSVCMYGHIVLFDLCMRLDEIEGLKIINVNTDGVGFTCESDEWNKVWDEWEDDWNLVLEDDHFGTFVQKDVNNYMATAPRSKEVIKAKGGQVSKYKEDQNFKDNGLRVIDFCLVEGAIMGNSPRTVIARLLKEGKYNLFQQVCDVGSIFDHAEDMNGVRLVQKINRGFAVIPSHKTHKGLMKVRIDGTKAKFPNVPENILIYNDSIDSLDNFNRFCDRGYYETLAEKRLKDWDISIDSLR